MTLTRNVIGMGEGKADSDGALSSKIKIPTLTCRIDQTIQTILKLFFADPGSVTQAKGTLGSTVEKCAVISSCSRQDASTLI